MAFVRVCSTSEVAPGEALRTESDVGPVALFNVDGAFYAIEDTCSHGQWSLAEGYLTGTQIECTLHMAKFCVRTGKACTLPATKPVKIFPVRQQGEDVMIDFDGGHYAA
jgi:nitrite reductase/ring-hydroxylating ferredoxin subunit